MGFEWILGIIFLVVSWLFYSVWSHDKNELNDNKISILFASVLSGLMGIVYFFYFI